MAEKYQITGRLFKLADTQTFPSGFQKREFVLEETEGKYPQQIKFDAVKDGCTKLDQFRVGDNLTVHFNLRGNEFQGKFYVSLQAWKFEGQGTASAPLDEHNQAKANGYAPVDMDDLDDQDSIPF
jgi:hypothetical protein